MSSIYFVKGERGRDRSVIFFGTSRSGGLLFLLVLLLLCFAHILLAFVVQIVHIVVQEEAFLQQVYNHFDNLRDRFVKKQTSEKTKGIARPLPPISGRRRTSFPSLKRDIVGSCLLVGCTLTRNRSASCLNLPTSNFPKRKLGKVNLKYSFKSRHNQRRSKKRLLGGERICLYVVQQIKQSSKTHFSLS